jgi:hypothetical protein
MSNSAAAASGTVVVIVGPEEKRYTLHKRLLEYHSGYFRSIFTKRISECRLRGVSVKGFDIFIDWMYETSLRSYTDDTESIPHMFHAYLVATKLLIGSFKTAVMEEIFDLLSGRHLHAAVVGWCFEVLPDNDPLLVLIVDTFCVNNGVKEMSIKDFATIDDLPKQYLVRILRKLHQLSKLPEDKRVLDREDYYSMVVCLNSKAVEKE